MGGLGIHQREAAVSGIMYSVWHSVDHILPATNREVFTWVKGYGIFYCSRYNKNGWNLSWQPTHWMERPDPPEEE